MDHFLIPFEIKASNSEDGIISGYGSVFGKVDSVGDTVAHGAFARTIADAKSGAGQWPAMLLEHGGNTAKSSMPIGIWLDMKEDSTGLRLTGKLALRTKRGAEAYALLQMKPRAALNGLSIGYRTRDSELHRSGTGPSGAKRTLKSVDLIEVSLVSFPADKYARVASVKARPMTAEDRAAWAMAEFELLRSLTNRN